MVPWAEFFDFRKLHLFSQIFKVKMAGADRMKLSWMQVDLSAKINLLNPGRNNSTLVWLISNKNLKSPFEARSTYFHFVGPMITSGEVQCSRYEFFYPFFLYSAFLCIAKYQALIRSSKSGLEPIICNHWPNKMKIDWFDKSAIPF